jgi:hypothetical protein
METSSGWDRGNFRFEYTSSPRRHLLIMAGVGCALCTIWFLVMKLLEPIGAAEGSLGIFLIVPTVALFVFTLRRKRTVILDEANMTVRWGSKEVVVPWRAFGPGPKEMKKQFKLEDIMGWERLSIKVYIYGEKVSFSLDQIFGVGLPVSEIAAKSMEAIRRTTGV